MVVGRRCGGFAAAAHSPPRPARSRSPLHHRCVPFVTRSSLHSSQLSRMCSWRIAVAMGIVVRSARWTRWALPSAAAAAAAGCAAASSPSAVAAAAAAAAECRHPTRHRTPVAHTRVHTSTACSLLFSLFMCGGRCSGGIGVAASSSREAEASAAFANQPTRGSGNNKIWRARLQRKNKR